MAQDPVIQRAMEAVRVLNGRDDAFKGQQWQGSALEFICADFLSGVDPRVIRVLDSMEMAVEEALARVEGKMTGRKERKIRARVRDELAEKHGLYDDSEDEPEEEEVEEEEVEEEEVDEEEVDEEEEEEEEEDDDEEEEEEEEEGDDEDDEPVMIPDGGRLYEAVSQTMEEFDGGDKFKYELSDQLTPRLMQLWTTGYLLKIIGDPRTEGQSEGFRPEVYLWVSDEDDENVIDFGTEYSDVYDELLDVTPEIVELLPTGYDALDDDDKWEKPHVADRREELPDEEEE